MNKSTDVAMAETAMKPQLHKRLLWRELAEKPSYSGVRGIYGDRTWIDDLDIVNELGGHTGCVNALRYGYTVTDSPA